MEVVQACFIIIDVAAVAEGGGGEAVSGYRMSLIVFYGNQRSPRVIIVGICQAAVLVYDFDDITLNVFDVVIHDVITGKRNRAVAAVIVEMQRIITLYHGNQVVSGIIVIMSIALLRAQAVDIILHVDIIAVLSDGFEPSTVFPRKRRAAAILERTTHSVIVYGLPVI